jgi:hypothetical protein
VSEAKRTRAIATTAVNPAGVAPWKGTLSEPPTQGAMNDFAADVEALRAALAR